MIPTLDELRERRIPLAGQALVRIDFTAEYQNDHEFVTDPAEANAITSIVGYGGSGQLGGEYVLHKPVLDIDLPCELIPSSTPGHCHLFVNKIMSWATYVKLLEALTAAGIVEPGYLAAALSRGHTAVRLPWVRKGGA